MSGVVTFTLDADAVQGDQWNACIGELVELASRCELIDLARTTGGRREALAGPDVEAASRRRALMEQLAEVHETAVFGVSHYDEGAVYGGPDDQPRLEAIHGAVWPKKAALDLSEINDVMHLATHLKTQRDYFVTTDRAMHLAAERLLQLRIQVVTPSDALALAQTACQSHLEPGAPPERYG